MSPDASPSPPTPGTPPAPENAPAPERAGWSHLKNRAGTVGRSVALLTFLVLLSAAGGYFYLHSRTPATKSPTISTLSPDDLSKLGVGGNKFGSPGQTLTFIPNSVFKGTLAVSGDLTVGGHLNTGSSVALSSLSVTGTATTAGLNVGAGLVVGGDATLQKAVTIAGLASVGSLNVASTSSLASVNATSLVVRTISASGPVTISHLVTQGPTPSISAGAVGTGGTVAISGNDTAGVITINTGSSPGSVLATITFRAAYGASVHVLLTPRTTDAAGVGAYVTSTAGAFQLNARSPIAGTPLSFDYLVAQ